MQEHDVMIAKQQIIGLRRFIEETDEELITLGNKLSPNSVMRIKNLIADSIRDCRKFRTQLAKEGIFQFGTSFISYNNEVLNA